MSTSFEKSVKGATKIKNAPPKSKYIEHLLIATHSGDAGVGEVFRSLQYRLRDSTWTVVLKSLLTVHLMILEGAPDVTLAFLSKHRNILGVGHFSDAQTQGRNIRHYANYLSERARGYRETKTDWVRANDSKLEKLTVEKGLLRETESVQAQLAALVKCDVLETEPENEITVAIFRLLVLDLLALFQVLNQGLINVLGHFFEMSKTDAERAMEIYRNFTRQTDYVVQYLSSARLHEHHTRVEVPKLKHAPVNLGRQLEEYLKDPDFEVHRRQYLAEQDAKKKGVSARTGQADVSKSLPQATRNSNNPFPTASNAQTSAQSAGSKGADRDLIDFFGSIDLNQTPMQVNPQPTGMPFQVQQTGMPFPQNGFMSQPTAIIPNGLFQQNNAGPFALQQSQPQPLQANFTGAGFGGYTPQPSFRPGALSSIPQNSEATFQTQTQAFPATQQLPMQTGQPSPLQPMQTGTNPFRHSMIMMQPTGMQSTPSSPPAQQVNRHSTNPFARSLAQPSSIIQPSAPLQAQNTGTNPFAKNNFQPQAQNTQPLAPQSTGATNPFRHGPFVNHSTGMGWQHNQGVIGGGIDQLTTIPVFPRPAQQTPWQP